MIITCIQSGLGNQMFQYACGLAIAKHKGVPLKIQIIEKDAHFRPYQLDDFNISAPKVRLLDYIRAGIPPMGYGPVATLTRRIFRMLDNRKPPLKRKIILEPQTRFTEQMFDVPNDCAITGNWQTEKYFASITRVIRKEFTLKRGFGTEASQYAKKIIGERRGAPVSMHIRRGDSVSQPHSMDFHGSPDATYYLETAKLIREKVGAVVIYVFSDDPKWVNENIIAQLAPAVTVSSPGISGAEDIILMSLCNHHIIAHSSFSWWGAWLNQNPDKIVLRPKRWYKKDIDTRDLTPASWIQVDNNLI